MSKIIFCDVCNKEGEENEDGGCYCEYHSLLNEIPSLKREYEEHRRWVINIHVHKLQKMKQEILEKEKRIKEIEQSF